MITYGKDRKTFGTVEKETQWENVAKKIEWINFILISWNILKLLQILLLLK